ncbi:MAG: putative LPS assembly protein LptD, partial [bacterium]
GYYETVKTFDADSNIVEERRDKFSFRGGSSTPKGELASLNFSVNNLFQMKTGSGEKEKKIDLFSMNMSSGYNFAAEQKKLSGLRTSINATPSRQFNVSLSMSHSPYVYDDSLGREIDRFLWEDKGLFGGRYFRLTNLSISSSIRLGGKSTTTAGAGAGAYPPAGQFDEFDSGPNRFEGERPFSAGIPWRANLTFSYTLSSFNPNQKVKRAYLNIRNAEINLTENWRVRFNGQIDLNKKQLISQFWTFHRDMHCWEASLSWTPIGPARGFYFRINVKASHLQDLKIERRGGRSSVFGGGYY